MKKDEPLTLKNIRKSSKLGAGPKQAVRLSDLLTEAEREQYVHKNKKVKETTRPYDGVDAFVAEMIARFGYAVYQDWNAGELSAEKINKWIMAEHARDKQKILNFEALILAAVAGAWW